MEITGVIKTTIVADENKSHVYEITKELGGTGAEVILLTLYPTVTEAHMLDLSMMHMLNHAADEGLSWNKIHFVYLFSKVAQGRLSTRGLKVDSENLEYIGSLIRSNPEAKIVVAFGASMEKCPSSIESKVRLFEMIKKIRGEKSTLWQLSADEMNEEAPHMLFAGIRYGDREWGMRHYVAPPKYSREGYASYLAAKEAKRERFIKDVLGKNKDQPAIEDVSEQEETISDSNQNEKETTKKKAGRSRKGKQEPESETIDGGLE